MWRQLTREPYRVALDLADADLAQALVEAIEAHPALVIASDKGLAHVVIVDRDLASAPVPLLRLDGEQLSTDADPDLIVSAAHLTAAGLRLNRSDSAGQSSVIELSPRERQVLAMMVDGAPNKAIARVLSISDRTAKFHVAAILAKLGARNRSEAVAMAFREGLVLF